MVIVISSKDAIELETSLNGGPGGGICVVTNWSFVINGWCIGL